MSVWNPGLWTPRAALVGLATALSVSLAAASAKAEQISVTHWGVLMYGAPYAVAMDKGFFKEEGVEITGILTSKGGGTTVRNVLAGGLPYGEVSLAAAVAAAQEGIDTPSARAQSPSGLHTVALGDHGEVGGGPRPGQVVRAGRQLGDLR